MTTPKQSNLDWLRCYYDAFNRRDWEWIGAMLAPDVEWVHASRDERVRGAQAVISSFRSLIEAAPTAVIDVRSVHDAGMVIIAECGIRHVKPATGNAPARPASRPSDRPSRPPAVLPATFCEVLQLSGGRCVRGSTYADSVRLLMDISESARAA
jgi:ketosteroid isomerase-like protein